MSLAMFTMRTNVRADIHNMLHVFVMIVCSHRANPSLFDHPSQLFIYRIKSDK